MYNKWHLLRLVIQLAQYPVSNSVKIWKTAVSLEILKESISNMQNIKITLIAVHKDEPTTCLADFQLLVMQT